LKKTTKIKLVQQQPLKRGQRKTSQGRPLKPKNMTGREFENQIEGGDHRRKSAKKSRNTSEGLRGGKEGYTI